MIYDRRFLNIFFDEDGGDGVGGEAPAQDVSEDIKIEVDSSDSALGEGAGQEEESEHLPAYFSQLKKESREKYKALAKYGTLDELAEIALKGENTKEPDYSDYVKFPTAESSKEELREFLTKMGVPETPDKYDIKIKETAGPFEKAIEKTVREQAFRAGLSGKQAQTMYGVAQAVVDFCIREDGKAKEERIKGFDTRYENLYKEQYPNKSQRDAAIKEDLGYLQNFLSETGLSKAMKDAGALYDENIMKGLAQYHKRMKGSFKSGPSVNESGSSGKSMIQYDESFYKKFGG